MKLILTCEHGGNKVPLEYEDCFHEAQAALNSHRGYDPGALDLFQDLKALANYEAYCETTRLLVELNRSLHHPQLFSRFTKALSASGKKELLEQHYFPYRNRVESKISESIEKGEEILHISVHSFTPVLDGEVRKTDIGLLFDPSRSWEKEFCKQFRQRLKALNPDLVTRFNYPYLGKADGFPTYLRKRFPRGYNGIELEVNQKFVDDKNRMQEEIKKLLSLALKEVL